MKNQILEEMTEKREACVKHFRMAQKGAAAVMYPMPVHYEEGGQWKEIDNRIEPAVEDGREVYKNHASSLKVRFAKEPGKDSLVMVEKDGRKVSWRLDSPQETVPGAGTATQDTTAQGSAAQGVPGAGAAEPGMAGESTMTQGAAGAMQAVKTFRVLKEAQFWKDPAVLKEEKREQAMAQMQNEAAQATENENAQNVESMAAQATENVGVQPAESTTAKPAETAAAKPESAYAQMLENKALQSVGPEDADSQGLDTEKEAEQPDTAELREKLAVPHLTGEGMYEGILPGVDLHYVIHGERIKENIRLHTKQAAAQQLAFTFTHPGMEMRM